MLTDYKINGEPIGISQCVGSGGYKVTSSVFKQNGKFITGDKYLSSKGQRRVLPDGTLYKNDTDTGFAAYGTACYGGATPDFERSSGSGVNDPGYYYFFFNGTQLSYTYRYDYVAKTILRTYHTAPFLKIWIAACGSGGGGANNEGAGGGGGGFAILPIILEPDHPIRIYIGYGGLGGSFEDSNTYHSGSNGNDTTIAVLDGGQYKTIAIMKGGTGGYDGNRTELKYAPGGDVYLFGKGNTYLPTRWLDYLSASNADDLECEARATTDNHSPSQVNSTLCTACAGASGGGGHKKAGVDGGQCFISGRMIDYSYCFGRTYWYTTTGKENGASEDHASGGGASAYYGSSGGNGGNHGNGSSGTYGGGGGSGDCQTILFDTTAYGGGSGGQGCFSMWFPHASSATS